MYQDTRQPNAVRLGLFVTFAAVFVIAGLIMLFGSWTVVDEGERAVVTRVGKIEKTFEPGFHFKIPLAEDVTKMSVRTQKIETEATAASADLQDVTTNLAVQFNIQPEAIKDIYSVYRNERTLRSTEIDPAIQDAIKAATSQYNASELVTKRPEVKQTVENILRERLAKVYVNVSNVDIVNFAFSPDFTGAIEEKVTAEQNAEREENRLRQVKAEAAQRVEQATAEAEAIRIQAQAITQQGGENYVRLKWVEAWQAGGSQVPKFITGDGGQNFLLDVNSI